MTDASDSFYSSGLLLKKEQALTAVKAAVASLLMENGWFLTTAESCTGGMIAAACTDLAGSSGWFERGFVTYSNAAKTQMLGVATDLIATEGAVSQAVVRAMALGAIEHSHAQVAVAVTGVAGPTGGSLAKPVGTVWFGFVLASPPGHVVSEVQCFEGGRAEIRQATVQYALQRLAQLMAPC